MATNKIQTGLRLNEVLYKKLLVLASMEQRSLNNLVEYVVQRYVDKYEETNGTICPPDEE